jgi:enoyl-CoA hydratase
VIRHERRGEAGQVSLLTLDRPERRNALDTPHWKALADAVRKAGQQGARAIAITGAGSSFCAGGDLNEPDYRALAEASDDCLEAITSVPVPVIAHVNGPAVGAGLILAVTCDLRVAEPTARFAIPAAAISRPVHPAVIRMLVAHAGIGASRAMLLGGEWLEADRAYQLGLVNRLGDLSQALGWGNAIADYAPLLVEYFKEELLVADEQDSPSFHQLVKKVLDSEDYAEAALANQEKRPPRFVGR